MESPETASSLLDQLRGRVPRMPVTLLLIALNLVVFGAMLFHGAGLWHSPNTVQLAWGANFGPATEDGEWWRLGSALFLHFGLVHLAMNMLALWEGGSFVERMYGSGRFAIIYGASGLTGNLLSLVAQGGRAVAGGASGAIFGIYGALLIFLWASRRHLDAAEFRWLFWGAAAFSAVTVALGFAISGIDNAAHIGGFLGGCLMGVFLFRPFAPGAAIPGTYRRAAVGALGLTLALLFLSVPPPRYRWRDELTARDQISQFLGEEQAINLSWDKLLREGKAGDVSFEQLAGRIDSEITEKYDQTFEQLSSMQLGSAAPSAQALETVRRYVELRRDASRNLAEGLRLHDRKQIREALDLARRAPNLAKAPAAKPSTRSDP
jgi:rhomboid protease GluP